MLLIHVRFKYYIPLSILTKVISSMAQECFRGIGMSLPLSTYTGYNQECFAL